MLSMLLTKVVMRFCNERGIFDQPNARKVHKCGVPRLGGICFLPSMLVAFVGAILLLSHSSPNGVVIVNVWSCMFFVSLLIIYLTGVIDDLIGINAVAKFIMQIVAAAVLPFCGLYINNLYGFLGIGVVPGFIGIPLTIFIIVFITNAMNLIDGIDGLCGSISLLALAGFMFCFAADGIISYALLIAALMGTIVAFLYFNIFGDAAKKNKIFMGDAGSLTLGFILGFLMVKYSMYNQQAIFHSTTDHMMIATTLLLVPCFDVVRVIISRVTHHRGIFTADKNHLHHKLLRAGLSQHGALIAIVLLSLFYLVLNTLLSYMDVYFTFVIIIDIVLWAAGTALLNMIIRRNGQEPFVTS